MFWYGLVALLVVCGILLATQVRFDLPVRILEERYARTSRYVDVRHMRVHYRDEGQGPPVVLLHGTSSSLHTWDGWVAALKGRFRIIRMDLPGFGLTGPAPDRDYRISTYVRFTAEFLDALGLTRVSVAGNSLGGHIAWRFALTSPERVQALVLVDAAGYPLERTPLAFRLAQTPVLNALTRWVNPQVQVERSLREVYGDGSKITPVLVDRIISLTLRAGNRQAFIDRANTREELRYQNIPHIRVPTLILWGESDRWIPVSHGRRFTEEITGSALIAYPGVGHVPMEEIPDRSAEDVRQFLERARG